MAQFPSPKLGSMEVVACSAIRVYVARHPVKRYPGLYPLMLMYDTTRNVHI